MRHNFSAADLAVKLLDQRKRTFHNLGEKDGVLFDDTLSTAFL
jgi:hypothetical protein